MCSSESEAGGGTTSDFLFLGCWGCWLQSSFFLFFLTFCGVCSSGGSGFCSVKLCLCFSFAFCCSLASNAWQRDSFETLPSSSSPRYLWSTWEYSFFSPVLLYSHNIVQIKSWKHVCGLSIWAYNCSHMTSSFKVEIYRFALSVNIEY